MELFFRLVQVGIGTLKADEGNFVGFDCVKEDHRGLKSWNDLFQMGVKQGVAAIQLDGLQKMMEAGVMAKEQLPPREVTMAWASHTMQVERRWRKHKEVIDGLVEFYASHGIRMMVIKGYSLSLLYPRPEHRPCGDVDIWLFGEQDRADRLLNEERGVEIDRDHHHHTVFHVDGVMIENHYDFFNIHAHLSSREIERELHGLLEEVECNVAPTEGTGKVKLVAPPADFNALFLLRHAAAHFAAEEIAIRHVVDWAMFVMHNHKEIDWERLETIAKKQNMHRFLHCLNGICIDYLGVPEGVFTKFERDKALEGRVMKDILYPAFPDKSAIGKNVFRDYAFRLRRWWANRWKHRMVYREGLLFTFLVQIRCHLMTPEGKR